MDASTLFRQLGVGAKFNFQRFRNDAEKLKIIKKRGDAPSQVDDRALPGVELQQFQVIPEVQHQGDNGQRNPGGVSGKRKYPEDVRQGVDEHSTSKRLHAPHGATAEAEESCDSSSSLSEQCESEGSSDDDEKELRILGAMTSTTMASSRSSRVKKSGRRIADRVTQIHREEVNALRNRHKIHVQGTDLPEPVESFSQLQTEYQLLPQLVENIVAVGYVDPTPIQMQAVTVMMHRRELLACAPTGSGKTAAFILPALTHLKKPGRMGFRVVVVSPTRELAKQTYREFQRLATGTGFHICMIGKSDVAKQKFGPKSPQKFDILVTTPNRLIHLLQLTPPGVSMKNVEWLIVDECDKLFEAGKQGFRDQLAVIYKACDSSHVRRAMFSATYTYEVEQWCKLNLDNVVTVCVGGRNSATMSVKQELLYVGAESGKMVAMRELVKKGFSPPVLVFVQSKERAQDLYSELAYDGINVNVIHSDKTQLQRDNIVRDFRSGKIWMLICTELMGRGMDFKGVNLVINYDFPPSAISYIHRIGRTGRAGRSGEAVTFFTDEDLVNLRSIAAVMRQTGCDVPGYMLRLRKASKKVRRKLEKHAPKRESISTGKKKKAPFKRNEEGKKQGAVSDMVDRPSAASKIQTGAPKKKSKKTNLKKKKKMKPKKSQPSGGAVKKH